MKNKRIILGLFFVVVVFVVLFLLFRRQTKPPETTIPKGRIPVVPTSQIQNANSVVQYSFPSQEPSLPTGLPVYTLSQPNRIPEIRTLTQKLGLPETPTQNSHTGSFQWLNDQYVLTYYPDTGRLSFYSNNSVETPPATREEAINTAYSFFPPSKMTLGNISAKPDSVLFVKTYGSGYDPVPSLLQANMAIVSFLYTVNGAVIYTEGGVPLTSQFQIHGGGQVRSASVAFPPSITRTNERPIVPVALARQQLTENKARLLWIASPQTPIEASILNVSFSDVQITNESLGYLYTKNTTVLLPIYVFSGVVNQGNDQTRGATVKFAVPAAYE